MYKIVSKRKFDVFMPLPLIYILPSEVLNGIIEKLPLYKCKYIRYLSKTMARSNPLVYDVNNYNINSFEIGKGHKCLGTELDIYKKNLAYIKKTLTVNYRFTAVAKTYQFVADALTFDFTYKIANLGGVGKSQITRRG